MGNVLLDSLCQLFDSLAPGRPGRLFRGIVRGMTGGGCLRRLGGDDTGAGVVHHLGADPHQGADPPFRVLDDGGSLEVDAVFGKELEAVGGGLVEDGIDLVGCGDLHGGLLRRLAVNHPVAAVGQVFHHAVVHAGLGDRLLFRSAAHGADQEQAFAVGRLGSRQAATGTKERYCGGDQEKETSFHYIVTWVRLGIQQGGGSITKLAGSVKHTDNKHLIDRDGTGLLCAVQGIRSRQCRLNLVYTLNRFCQPNGGIKPLVRGNRDELSFVRP
ncbi:protein of unknown function [Trichlorobacter ammonificans]|uniref:Uncharacterized protein n=1 Tax=Trichlorobacter ammonificans TaxID=2916410 RepID=A0ABN8HH34_9BACT|nr:protein of unknown function [Trichlorobacter ammonificans]